MAPKIKRYADSTEVREWAMSLSEQDRKALGLQDIEVSERGRFHSRLVDAFNRAMRQQGVRYVPIGRKQPRLAEVFAENDHADDKPEVYRQPRQEATVPEQRSDEAALPQTPDTVLELLRTTHQPVMVVYVPVSA